MYAVMAITFVVGYLAIALEHNIRVDKAASALMLATVLWVMLIFAAGPLGLMEAGAEGAEVVSHTGGLVNPVVAALQEHLGEISEILFFLLGAMTIVELIDAHDGFKIITDRITTLSQVKLMWSVSLLAFFLSAVIDNLTATIVMVSLLAKLVQNREQRWWFVGMLIIAANAGGAWSPIGDVTTTMLWIGGQVTAGSIVPTLFLPSLVCLLTPLIILSFRLKGEVTRPINPVPEPGHTVLPVFERNLVLGLGIALLLFVPVFKTITHLPPYMGILFGLSVLWVVTEVLHGNKSAEDRHPLTVVAVLRKVDTASVLFFLGILLAVSALSTAGHLIDVARLLERSFQNVYVINLVIGLLSAIVDNVPLVAGAMKMYPLEAIGSSGWAGYFVQNGDFWKFLAYCAGTGGSCLIIGSAAGVAAMGMERISFSWYLKNISLLALAGYLAGAATYLLMYAL